MCKHEELAKKKNSPKVNKNKGYSLRDCELEIQLKERWRWRKLEGEK